MMARLAEAMVQVVISAHMAMVAESQVGATVLATRNGVGVGCGREQEGDRTVLFSYSLSLFLSISSLHHRLAAFQVRFLGGDL